MSLDIGAAVSEGFDRTFKKNGLMIIGLFFISGLLNTVLGHTLNSALTQAANPGNTALALPLSPAIAGFLWIPVAIFSAAIGITALRVFTESVTDKIPEKFYKRNMPMAILNVIVGGLVFGLGIGLIFALPLVPGLVIAALGSRLIGILVAFLGLLISVPLTLYVLVSLYLWNLYVAVEDRNFIEAFKDSWDITEGHKISLFALGIIVVIFSGVLSWLAGLPALAGLNALGAITAQIGGAVGSAFSAATLAQAYNQLKNMDDDEEVEDDQEESTESDDSEKKEKYSFDS